MLQGSGRCLPQALGARRAKPTRLLCTLRAAEAWASSCHQQGLFLLGAPSPPAALEKELPSCTQLPCPAPSCPSSCPSSCPPTRPAAGWEARTLPQSSPCLEPSTQRTPSCGQGRAHPRRRRALFVILPPGSSLLGCTASPAPPTRPAAQEPLCLQEARGKAAVPQRPLSPGSSAGRAVLASAASWYGQSCGKPREATGHIQNRIFSYKLIAKLSGSSSSEYRAALASDVFKGRQTLFNLSK